jgi:hypothetical protein
LLLRLGLLLSAIKVLAVNFMLFTFAQDAELMQLYELNLLFVLDFDFNVL